jgi:phosphatidylinositol phosphate synthase
MLDGRWRQRVDRTTQPVGRALVRAGVNADVLTIFGLVMSAVTAFVVGTGHLVLGVVMLFPTGLPDLFDGPVAKASGTASVRGAFFDSVADRISDAFLYGGVAWYLAARGHGTMVLLPFAILAVTSLVSYERAKAELLGLSAGGGLMERAERFILLGACFCAGAVDESAFVPALWVFFGLVTATALGRFVRIWQQAEGPVRPVGGELRTVSVQGATGADEPPGALTRRVARRRDRRADSRRHSWREAIAQRRTAEPLSWWRSRREAVPGSRTGRSWRERRAARPSRRIRIHERTGRHSADEN